MLQTTLGGRIDGVNAYLEAFHNYPPNARVSQAVRSKHLERLLKATVRDVQQARYGGRPCARIDVVVAMRFQNGNLTMRVEEAIEPPVSVPLLERLMGKQRAAAPMLLRHVGMVERTGSYDGAIACVAAAQYGTRPPANGLVDGLLSALYGLAALMQRAANWCLYPVRELRPMTYRHL